MKPYIIKNNLPTIIGISVIAILFLLLVFSLKTYLADQEELTGLQQEVGKLKSKSKILETNKNLTEQDINDYNNILAHLVPESEDFFSIIYALETLSSRTGFAITGYVINLSSSTKDKYSLTVQGDSDAKSFLQFLKRYNFEGGRLITNEKIEFSPTDIGKMKLALNFYSKKIPKNIKPNSQISQKDLGLMNEIKSKMTVNLKSINSDEVEDYPTKTNPFAP